MAHLAKTISKLHLAKTISKLHSECGVWAHQKLFIEPDF